MKCSRYISHYLRSAQSNLKLCFICRHHFSSLFILTPTPYRHSSDTKARHDSLPRFKREMNGSIHIFTFLKNNKFLARFAFLYTFILYLLP